MVLHETPLPQHDAAHLVNEEISPVVISNYEVKSNLTCVVLFDNFKKQLT